MTDTDLNIADSNIHSHQPTTELPQKRSRGDISRENGSKSMGPKTAQGKQRSSRNATIHNFTSERCSYSNQTHPGINRIYHNLVRELHPGTPVEVALVHTMALAQWQERTVTEELAALVNHTRDTQITDPAYSDRLRNILAIDKINKEGNTFINHQRYLREAERRFARALHELHFVRKHSHELHELTSAASHIDYEFHSEHAPEPVQTENAGKRNEPKEVIETIEVEKITDTQNSPVYSGIEPPRTQITAISKRPTVEDCMDPRKALELINNLLIDAYPEAHSYIAQELCKLH